MFPSVFPGASEPQRTRLSQYDRFQGLRLQIANWLSLIGLYLFCSSLGPSTAGVNLALGTLLCASLLAGDKLWLDLRSLPLFWISLILAAYITLQSYFCIQAHPILSQQGNPHWTHLLLISGLPSLILAWWMVRHQIHIPVLLILTVLGFGVEFFAVEAEWSHFWERAVSSRGYWGNVIEVGYVSALGLCTCAVMGCRFLLKNPARSWTTWFLPLLLAVAGYLFGVVLYGSQVRGAWIAASITISLFLGYELFRAVLRKYAVKRALLFLSLLTFAVFLLIRVDPANNLHNRFDNFPKAMNALINLKLNKVYQANRSLGARLNMWREGWEAIKEKPFFGWGEGGVSLIEEINVKNNILLKDGHLHNFYLEVLFSIGLFGAILFLIIFCIILKNYLIALYKKNIHKDIIVITLIWLLITLIMWIEEVLIGFTIARSVIILLIALLLMPMILENHQNQKY